MMMGDMMHLVAKKHCGSNGLPGTRWTWKEDQRVTPLDPQFQNTVGE